MTVSPIRLPSIPMLHPMPPAIATTLRWVGLVVAVLAAATLGACSGVAEPTVMGAILLAATISSVAGFAFSAICGAMLFHLVAVPVEVVQIMMVCSIANQASMTWALRRDVTWRDLSPYLAGAAMGVPAGVLMLLHANHARYIAALGVLLIAYGTWMLAGRRFTIARPRVWIDLVAGFCGGVTGGAAAFPGAPVAICCGAKDWGKTRQRAAFQPFILAVQVVALVAISLARPHGALGAGFDAGNLLYVPASLLGTALGMLCFGRVSDGGFARAVNLLLIVSGVSFVV